MPNADHSLKDTDAPTSLLAFYGAIVKGVARPKFDWSADKDGTLVIRPETKPRKVTFWQATNPVARDFRIETLGPVWKGTEVQPDAQGVYRAKAQNPIGVLIVWRLHVQPFTDAEIGLLQTFADQAAIAIANANLFETVQR